MTESEWRDKIVTETRSWIGTPYHLGARSKGAGCDCATIIAEVLISCGVSDREDLGFYGHDWFHHSKSERYLLGLLRHATKTLETVAYRSTVIASGSIILTRAARARVYNHGGIVTCWPKICHAIMPMVEEVDASTNGMWAYRQIAVFDPLAGKTFTC